MGLMLAKCTGEITAIVHVLILSLFHPKAALVDGVRAEPGHRYGGERFTVEVGGVKRSYAGSLRVEAGPDELKLINDVDLEDYVASVEEVRGIGLDPAKVKTLYRGRGCKNCQGTGYQGRTGIYELMLIDDEIRQLILKNVDSSTIKHNAREHGMLSLRDDGAEKVMQGITTAEEVSRVTQEDSMSLEAFG